jgi:hypothetical protein
MKGSTKRIENLKDFVTELNLIEKFNSLDNYPIILINQDIEAKLSRGDKNFLIRFDTIKSNSNLNEIEFLFKFDGIHYNTKRIDHFSTNTSVNIDIATGAKSSSTLDISTFQSLDFKSLGRFKAFYKVDLNEIRSFHSQFETLTHQRGAFEYFYECIRLKVEGKTYDITQFKTQDVGYYVFECLVEETFENYHKACFSIKQAIGFINKLMVGDEEFIFDDSNNLYYSNFIRQNIKGFYYPIVTNPYSLPDIEPKIADDFKDRLTRISSENLTNLVDKIHTKSSLSLAILTILEVMSVRSLLLMPSAFAVIIELLSKMISNDEVGMEKPISDKELAGKIIGELHGVIDENCSSLNEQSILKLKRRLNEINKPINYQHLKNVDKLTRPFEILGIKLTLHDINIIEHRNDLLHGNISLENENQQTDEHINLYMAYVSAKLFTLISKLILKSIGYDGYVYNNAKHIENHINISTEEEYFEKI